MLGDTVERLEAWGRWTRAHKLGGNSSPLYALMRDNVGGVVSVPLPCDDDALEIDRAVAGLKLRDPESGRAVFYYYVSGCSYRDLSAQLGVGVAKAKMLTDCGVAWIDGRLVRFSVAA